MPDKPLTIATYAAGVSLAAITLIYVFGPTYLIDGNSSKTSNTVRKKGVVGLSNPANDCFINSVLQCLAGLGDLRLYLIRETHRRELDGLKSEDTQNEETAKEKKNDVATLEDLRSGIVTRALKEVLDNLNERPLYKKTVSAGTFVTALERAFRQRISRQQQDAQEFLQIVAERLSEEYQRTRRRPRLVHGEAEDVTDDSGELKEEEEGFPLEGTLESEIECLSCHFKPKPSVSTFVTLTLNVPQQSATTLNNCFDNLLKTEYIDDFKCEKCRLIHAVEIRLQQLARTTSAHDRKEIEIEIEKLEKAIQGDPEHPPENVPLPDICYARIAKHVRIITFPKIIVIHLSRSIFDPGSASMKNFAKVSFPERLSLGGILDRKEYKLLGLISHTGNHHSGHYQAFRRQMVCSPYSTPYALRNNDSLSKAAFEVDGVSPAPPLTAGPRVKAESKEDSIPEASSTEHPNDPVKDSRQRLLPQSSSIPLPSPTSFPSCSSTSSNSRRLSQSSIIDRPTSAPRTSTSTDQFSLRSTLTKSPPTSSKPSSSKAASKCRSKIKNKSKLNDRWWRISDDKVKESKTSEVLSMQREVYLLFYQLET